MRPDRPAADAAIIPDVLYHSSAVHGLKILLPHVSTHGRRYVYAIDGKITSVLFGAPKDDFDLLTDQDGGVPVVYECYPGALQSVYGGRSCSVYEVGGEGFLSGVTGWSKEFVCERPVPVLREDMIPDIYALLTDAALREECVIHRYSADAEYIAMLREELSERVRAFGLTRRKMENDPRFGRYFPWLLDGE